MSLILVAVLLGTKKWYTSVMKLLVRIRQHQDLHVQLCSKSALHSNVQSSGGACDPHLTSVGLSYLCSCT